VATTNEISAKKNCTKCGGVLDTSGRYPLWCKSCQNAYKREYFPLRKRIAKSKGFHQGVEAMRQFLATNFERFDWQRFNGPEIARYIRDASAPTLPEEAN
jgi:tRNA(Ile2) C34 agmatinyltransferase TiaS